MKTGYRYASKWEVDVIKAATPWHVPNVNLVGEPKLVYFSWDRYDTVWDAEHNLRMGSLHPEGCYASPTDRLDLDLTSVQYNDLGIVPGGYGTEAITSESPPVTAITPLIP